MKKKFSENDVAIITGAGSGIGRALSIELSKKNVFLALSDRNNTSLAETKKLCNLPKDKILTSCLDVANEKEVIDFKNNILEKFGHIDLLFNNAGVGQGEQKAQEMSLKDTRTIIGVNLIGCVIHCVHFLPELLKSKNGRLINIASANSIIASKFSSAYTASKFAVSGYTQSLIAENTSNKNLSIHLVMPGGIKTNISKNAVNSDLRSKDFEDQLKISPQKAARVILRGVLKNKTRIIIGLNIYVVDYLLRLLPITGLKLVNKLFIKKG